MICEFTNGKCRFCGHVLKKQFTAKVFRFCQGIPCGYLGQKIGDGAMGLVKCHCKTSNGTREQWHPAHQCNAPQHQRNGKPGRCLPTMRQEFDSDHQLEASLYNICMTCTAKEQ